MTALKAEKQDLESVEAFEKKNKKMKRKRTIVDYMSRHKEAYKNNKIKSIIDFDEENTNSIKSLVVEKKKMNIKLNTRFMKGEMLMFAKTLLQSLTSNMIDIFCYPDQAVQEIYKKYHIGKCFMYQKLTDTYSTSLSFVFICSLNCTMSEKDSRKVLFEVIIASKIFQRLHLSDGFWEQFNVQNKAIEKQVGRYKIQSIDNANIITISVNPKEYLEKYRDNTVTKNIKN